MIEIKKKYLQIRVIIMLQFSSVQNNNILQFKKIGVKM